jgi:hypothetical protein
VLFGAIVALLIGMTVAAPATMFDLGAKHRDVIKKSDQEAVTKAMLKPPAE